MIPLALWLGFAGPLWAALGRRMVPSRYRRDGRDPRLTPLVGALGGASAGPLALAYFLGRRPAVHRGHVGVAAVLLGLELLMLFRMLAPANPCVTSPGYLLDQVVNGLTLGAVFATMAVGLTLIFSVVKIVNLAHGQFVMLGGVGAYLLLAGPLRLNALVAIPILGIAGFFLGTAVDVLLLAPMHRGQVERRDEFAVLMTYGLGMLVSYALLGILGPTSGLSAPRYTTRAFFGLERMAPAYVVGPAHLRTDVLVAGAAGVTLIVLLGVFLHGTWTGRSMRAVAMDPHSAATVGVDTMGTFMVAFGLGTALATMGGAALVPILAFSIPDIATQVAVTSWVIIVLGGLGSIPGAVLASFFIGVVQSLGAACYPDPSKGASYQVVFALVIFAAVLLMRPQGFFGRRS